MAPNSNKAKQICIIKKYTISSKAKEKKIESALYVLTNRRQQLLNISFVIALLLLSGRNSAAPIIRSCRRLEQNTGWWSLVWQTYSDARFKKAFRVSRNTFPFILERIRHVLERKIVRPHRASFTSSYLSLSSWPWNILPHYIRTVWSWVVNSCHNNQGGI